MGTRRRARELALQLLYQYELTDASPEEMQAGGIGLCLIHDIMDEVEYLPVPDGKGNRLRMLKRFKRDNNET